MSSFRCRLYKEGGNPSGKLVANYWRTNTDRSVFLSSTLRLLCGLLRLTSNDDPFLMPMPMPTLEDLLYVPGCETFWVT